MNYSNHINNIKATFPELDLLRESEFQSFKNEKFGLQCINSCIQLCNNASERLKIAVNFAVKYDYTFNAQAIVKNECGVILINLGLIEELELIISDSIEVFSKENIAQLTIPNNKKTELKTIFSDLCISYLFYHELAHILQLLSASSEECHNFQEQYSSKNTFDIKKHIYEIDADNFGITMTISKLLEYATNKTNHIDTVLLFNLLTTLLFSTANIIIEFSKNQFKSLYYKNHSHPHPIIRITRCNERILSFVSTNLTVKNELLLAILQRTVSLINQFQYKNKDKIDYSKLLHDNILEIEIYNNEIESKNEFYKELIRFRAQDIFNCLNKKHL